MLRVTHEQRRKYFYSVPRLGKLLSCYNPEERIALGEKYGFAMSTSHGYSYITGGGGMVFSKVLVSHTLSTPLQ